MKPIRKHILPALLAAALLASQCALAESITFTGTVAASKTVEVYAPIGGKVEAVSVEAGQQVNSAETVGSLYGAVVSIEGESVYSIAASTDNAYNSTATKFIHVGEAVYLSCYSDGTHTGAGVVTAVEGTDYTVRVTSGEFLIGETVNVYRGESAVSSMRIGRGTLNRVSPTAVTGTGSIVSIAVQPGDAVQRGDLLFETLDGAFDGLYMSGNEITADADGTVSQLNVQQGGTVQKGDVVAVLYPQGAMRVEAQVAEANLASIAVGDPVSIELIWNQDEEVTYPGTISGISALADSTGESMDGESTVPFTVYVDFTPDENTRYGMSAVETTLDGEALTEEAEPIEEVSEDARP